MIKLIYIGGYGRSGSTLLEYLLTASPSLVACGEVMRHLERFKSKKSCTCGRLTQECPVWGRLGLSRKQLKGWRHEELILVLLALLSEDYSGAVDSSKTAWRSYSMPFRLRRRLGHDFVLVHITRDPRAVCWSTIRKSGARRPTSAPMARAFRTSMGWMLANFAAELFGRRYPKQYMRVSYEELARSPEKTLRTVLKKIAVEPPVDLDPVDRVDNRHQLYGNSMRFKPLSISEVKEDVAWQDEMPIGIRRLATSVCWPLGTRYGYFS